MDYRVDQIQPEVWRAEVAGTIRIIRRVLDCRTLMPWDIFADDGRRLWAAATLDSAFRWIQARTGAPTEALLAERLLRQSVARSGLTHDLPQDLTVSGGSRPSIDPLNGSGAARPAGTDESALRRPRDAIYRVD